MQVLVGAAEIVQSHSLLALHAGLTLSLERPRIDMPRLLVVARREIQDAQLEIVTKRRPFDFSLALERADRRRRLTDLHRQLANVFELACRK